jgi:hypothetical protein
MLPLADYQYPARVTPADPPAPDPSIPAEPAPPAAAKATP